MVSILRIVHEDSVGGSSNQWDFICIWGGIGISLHYVTWVIELEKKGLCNPAGQDEETFGFIIRSFQGCVTA
jgi:hypothetical protein